MLHLCGRGLDVIIKGPRESEMEVDFGEKEDVDPLWSGKERAKAAICSRSQKTWKCSLKW